MLLGLQTYLLWAANTNGSANFYALRAPNINGSPKLGIMGFKLMMDLQTYELWAANINGIAKY